jgi:hypothetical protein
MQGQLKKNNLTHARVKSTRGQLKKIILFENPQTRGRCYCFGEIDNTQANQKLTAFLNNIWKTMISKGMNAMPALSKFLVLLALVLSASHANAFTSLSSVAGNQVWINHLTRLQQPMSDPTNDPSRKPIREPTK